MDPDISVPLLAESVSDDADSDGRPYVYSPLAPGEIRILTLHPGTHNEALGITISHTTLASSPPYEALSYHWESSEERRRVLCGESVITITPNLCSALTHLRYPNEARVVWVDTICIN
jgi:hypothetical protein